MDANKSVKVSFCLKDKNGDIQPFTDPEDPPHMTHSRRFNDDISSSRWILYLFDTEVHREEFIVNQPERFQKALISTPKQAFYDKRCKGVRSSTDEWY